MVEKCANVVTSIFWLSEIVGRHCGLVGYGVFPLVADRRNWCLHSGY